MRFVGFASFAISLLLATACSDDGGGSVPHAGGSSGAGGSVGAGGTRASTPPAAATYGRVTVAGSSDAVANTSHSFFGPPAREGSEGDFVRLRAYIQADASGPPRVEITAGMAGRLLPDVSAWFALPGDSPFAKEYSFDESPAPALELRARLTYDDAGSYYEYRYASGVGPSSSVRSYCWVTVTIITTQRIAGSLECRDLFATEASADHVKPGAPEARASITTIFDATPELIDVGPRGSGGTSSVGGAPSFGGSPSSGGSPFGGFPSAGSPAGGHADSDGGLGAGHCAGFATPCSIQSVTQCLDALGCALGGQCQGVATSCYSEFSSYACTSQSGCYWSSSSSSCSGSASSCSTQSGPSTCDSQDGCHWEDSCSGVAWECATLLSEVGCSSQPGCNWVGTTAPSPMP